MRPNGRDHTTLASWAAECAERVLARFEQERPEDTRPRDAVQAARAWVDGKLAMPQAREAALAAHQAAGEARAPAAVAAARAAGHAAATAHVPTHAPHAAAYAAKAAEDPQAERSWQRSRLPERLHTAVFIASRA